VLPALLTPALLALFAFLATALPPAPPAAAASLPAILIAIVAIVIIVMPSTFFAMLLVLALLLHKDFPTSGPNHDL